MFIHIEYSLQSTSILQWSTEDTMLQIHAGSCLHPKDAEVRELSASNCHERQMANTKAWESRTNQ